MPNYGRQLRRIVEDYQKAGMPTPFTLEAVAAWAIKMKRWKAPDSVARRKCAEELRRALRDLTTTDSKGQRARVMHPLTIQRGDEILHLWNDGRKASRDYMEKSFGQRRNLIVADCKQLKIDLDWYNGLHPHKEPIQLVLDFTDDVREWEALQAKRAKESSGESTAVLPVSVVSELSTPTRSLLPPSDGLKGASVHA